MKKKISTYRHCLDQLVCPQCRVHLDNVTNKLICKKCNNYWPVKRGIPYFIEDAPYWGEIDEKKMRVIVERLSQENWRNVLSKSDDEELQRLYKFTSNLNRANWQYLFSLNRFDRVLDLGAGTGTNSQALANRFKEVYAVEPVQLRLDFMRSRFRQENIDNVILIKGGWPSLPFEESFFDLIVLNGVLEWLPLSQPDRRPNIVQHEALVSLCSLLRPGGIIYIGIENRLGFYQFLGANDPHAGIPWVGLLPRKLANLYSLRKTGEPYRNYLYSAKGYQKLLRAAGLNNLSIYIACPSYNQPDFIIPFQNTFYKYYYFKMGYNSRRSWYKNFILSLAARSGLLANLEYAFILLAQK